MTIRNEKDDVSNFSKRRNSTKQSHFKQKTSKTIKKRENNKDLTWQNESYGTEFHTSNIYDEEDQKKQKMFDKLGIYLIIY
jgi:hypothetical protein